MYTSVWINRKVVKKKKKKKEVDSIVYFHPPFISFGIYQNL